MFKAYVFLVSALPALSCVLTEPECGAVANGSRMMNLSISHAKNTSGHWVTTASACQDSDVPNNRMDLNVRRSVTDCGGGKYIVHVRGVLTEEPPGKIVQKILFHPRHGRNVALMNNRTTAYRINENENHGVVYTDRPLRRNEMLEVRLDKTSVKFPYNLGIGITTHTPYESDTPDERIDLVKGMWLYYHVHIHINGVLALDRYGVNLDANFKVGDTVGVLVTDSDILHFYVNGVDQGPVAASIPHTVYGVIELRSKTLQASIT